VHQTGNTEISKDLMGLSCTKATADKQGVVIRVSDDLVLNTQPALSPQQRIEDWFFSHLPMEGEL
jgi:putative cardiolipin synthase